MVRIRYSINAHNMLYWVKYVLNEVYNVSALYYLCPHYRQTGLESEHVPDDRLITALQGHRIGDL